MRQASPLTSSLAKQDASWFTWEQGMLVSMGGGGRCGQSDGSKDGTYLSQVVPRGGPQQFPAVFKLDAVQGPLQQWGGRCQGEGVDQTGCLYRPLPHLIKHLAWVGGCRQGIQDAIGRYDVAGTVHVVCTRPSQKTTSEQQHWAFGPLQRLARGLISRTEHGERPRLGAGAQYLR